MEDKCKTHPSHKQSKGVCPYCLKERLEQLTAASSSSSANLSSSMASSAARSSYNDSSSSRNESPRHKHGGKRTLLRLLNKGVKEESLRRSSSLAFPTFVGQRDYQKRKKVGHGTAFEIHASNGVQQNLAIMFATTLASMEDKRLQPTNHIHNKKLSSLSIKARAGWGSTSKNSDVES